MLAVRSDHEVLDQGAPQRLLRVGRPFAAHVAGGRLRVDLAVNLGHLAVEAAVDVRVDLLRVVVVAQGLRVVPAELVELARRAPVGLVEAVDRVAVQRDRDRLALAERLLEEDRRVVVMVVVAFAAVAAEAVELAEFLGVVAAVVERVEDWHAVRGQRDRAAQEVRLGRHRLLRWHRVERDPPGPLADVRLRERHLLLPRLDAGHQRVVRQTLGLDVQVFLVPPDADLRGEGGEGSGQRGRGTGRAGRGR